MSDRCIGRVGASPEETCVAVGEFEEEEGVVAAAVVVMLATGHYVNAALVVARVYSAIAREELGDGGRERSMERSI